MQLLKIAFISTVLAAGLMADPECEQTLDRSMSLTDACLKEVQIYKSGGSVEKSSLLEQLRIENEQLVKENKKLREKIEGEHPKNVSAKNSKKSNRYKRYGKQLANQNRGVCDARLFEKGMYRIETQLINMRDEPTLNGSIAAVGNRGEVYPFSKIIAKKGDGGDTKYWVKGDLGWMYVTNSKTPEINTVLKNKAKVEAPVVSIESKSVSPVKNKKTNPTK